jgi:lipopolysaccharide transport system ATP-binding protein
MSSDQQIESLLLGNNVSEKQSTSGHWVIEVNQVSKCYSLFDHPKDRLKEFLMPKLHRKIPFWGKETYAKKFWSLRDVSVSLKKGEVLGVMGVNGAGKSSLLQLICGVLEPTSGSVKVKGRIAALLELGAGFNPEFSGRENIDLNAALMGLSTEEIKEKTPEIIAFSGIEPFIDQPVKTYSSGMYVRLAFAIATSVEPDVLIIDEALSVGDGAFTRKSFDRIMDLKRKGVTILFCSHNIYQVEALCQRAIWLHEGQIQKAGPVRAVAQSYNNFLDQLNVSPSGAQNAKDELGTWREMGTEETHGVATKNTNADEHPELKPNQEGIPNAQAQHTHQTAKLKDIKVLVNGLEMKPLVLQSGVSNLELQVHFAAGLAVPTPNVGLVITDRSGFKITSCSNFYDGVELTRDAKGLGCVRLKFQHIQLLRGHFVIEVFLLCEKALLIYDSAVVTEFEVIQPGLEFGVVSLQREWLP